MCIILNLYFFGERSCMALYVEFSYLYNVIVLSLYDIVVIKCFLLVGMD